MSNTTDLATINAPPELRESVSACVLWSQNNVIMTAPDFQATGEHLKEIKSRQKAADAFFDGPIRSAFELHKTLVARKRVITDPLAQSEKIDKQKILVFQQAEAAKAEAERRKLQALADEVARKEREKAEQEAAKQRAIEAEQRAKAEAARQAALQASEAERKKLLAEAEVAERKASAAAVKVEAKTEQAAASIAPVVQVASVAQKVAGVTTVKVWKWRVTDETLVPRSFLVLDEAKLTKYARAMRNGVPVAGIEFYSEDSLSSRGA